jgi:hypothetical protein
MWNSGETVAKFNTRVMAKTVFWYQILDLGSKEVNPVLGRACSGMNHHQEVSGEPVGLCSSSK